MSETEQPSLGEAIDKAMADFKVAAAKAGQDMAAQGAFGWMMQSKPGKAREALAKLPPEKLREVAAAAAAFTALVEEVAAEHPE